MPQPNTNTLYYDDTLARLLALSLERAAAQDGANSPLPPAGEGPRVKTDAYDQDER